VGGAAAAAEDEKPAAVEEAVGHGRGALGDGAGVGLEEGLAVGDGALETLGHQAHRGGALCREGGGHAALARIEPATSAWPRLTRPSLAGTARLVWTSKPRAVRSAMVRSRSSAFWKTPPLSATRSRPVRAPIRAQVSAMVPAIASWKAAASSG